MHLAFFEIALWQTFMCNGTGYIKVSSRSARVLYPHAGSGLSFYFQLETPVSLIYTGK